MDAAQSNNRAKLREIAAYYDGVVEKRDSTQANARVMREAADEMEALAKTMDHLLMLWVSSKGMDWNAVDDAVRLLHEGGYPMTLAVAERAGLVD